MHILDRKNPWQGLRRGNGEAEAFMRVLLLLRMGVFTLALGGTSFLLWTGQVSGALTPAGALLLAAYAVTGLYWLAFRQGYRSRFHVYGPMVGDIAVNAWIVHYSGGIESPFSFLFILTILCVGAVFQTRPALISAAASAACFGGLGWLEFSGVLKPAVDLAMDVQVSRDVTYAFFHVVFQMGFFFATAVTAGSLSGRLKAKGEALETTAQELLEMRHDTKNILEHMPSGLLSVDCSGTIVSLNRAAAEMLAVDPHGAIGRPLGRVLGPGSEDFRGVVEHVLVGGAPAPRMEATVRRSDGKEVPIGMSASVLTYPGGTSRGVVVVFQDLTEVRRMETQIRRADRLAAVGELSAAIAHEIRNPLASISGSIELLQAEPGYSDQNARLMKLVLKESRRLKRITSEFLDFAVAREKRVHSVDLRSVLREVVCLLKGHQLCKDDVHLEIRLDHNIARVMVDEEQLKQVLLNLGYNALEAMEGRGRLTLSGTAVAGGRPDRGNGSVDPGVATGQDLVLTVEDTGCGIQLSDQDKVFQPFFSSKPSGVGLGLGIVCRIVEDHGGKVQMESEKGTGTQVVVFLPGCVRGAMSASREAAPAGVS